MKQQNLTQKLNSNNKCQNHHSVTWPNNTHNKYSACDKNVTTMVECCDTSMVTTHTKKKNLNPLYCYNPWPKKKKKELQTMFTVTFFFVLFFACMTMKRATQIKKDLWMFAGHKLEPCDRFVLRLSLWAKWQSQARFLCLSLSTYFSCSGERKRKKMVWSLKEVVLTKMGWGQNFSWGIMKN